MYRASKGHEGLGNGVVRVPYGQMAHHVEVGSKAG